MKDEHLKQFKMDESVRSVCLTQQDSMILCGDRYGQIKYIDQATMREKIIKPEKIV